MQPSDSPSYLSRERALVPPAPVVHPRESPDATLAKNLVVARVVAGVTQQELAEAAGLSRATVAQLETGYSDPRLSTIVDLASALGIPPLLLLLGNEDVQTLVDLPDALSTTQVEVSANDLETMRRQVRSGLLKDRMRAARLGAAVVAKCAPKPIVANAELQADAQTPVIAVSAAVFSAILPGLGTVVGAALGQLFAKAKWRS